MSTCPGSATKHRRSRGSCFLRVCSAGPVMLIRAVLARSVLTCGCTRPAGSAAARNPRRLAIRLDAFDIASRARASPAASLGSAVACSASRPVRLSAVTCNRPVDVRGRPGDARRGGLLVQPFGELRRPAGAAERRGDLPVGSGVLGFQVGQQAAGVVPVKPQPADGDPGGLRGEPGVQPGQVREWPARGQQDRQQAADVDRVQPGIDGVRLVVGGQVVPPPPQRRVPGPAPGGGQCPHPGIQGQRPQPPLSPLSRCRAASFLSPCPARSSGSSSLDSRCVSATRWPSGMPSADHTAKTS